jgi:hypothetical protein
MVASAIFITDLTGKPLISRNYRGDIPLTSAIETFAKYLVEVEEDVKTPVFHVDTAGEFVGREDVGCTGVGGEAFVYVQVSCFLLIDIDIDFSERRVCIDDHFCHWDMDGLSHIK